MSITVYSKPACGKCKFVKLWLDNHSHDYNEIDVFEDNEAFEYVKSKGGSLPLVEIKTENGVESFTGYKEDVLDRLLG